MNIEVSIATKTKQMLHEAPGIISVITAEDIRINHCRDLIDVINIIPGLNVVKDIDNGAVVSQGLYGFEGRMLFMVEGMELLNMAEVTMMKIGSVLIVPIQKELHNRPPVQVQEDIIQTIEQKGTRGLLIDVSMLRVVDSFLGRFIGDIASMARVMGCKTVVVGLQPGVAITLMELGLHLEGVYTALNTETGLELLKQFIGDKTGEI